MDTITPNVKKHYDPESVGYIYAYLVNYPQICRRIAKEYGFQGGEDQSLRDWYMNLIQQYWSADQPTNKRSGSKDARIWLKTAMNTLATSQQLLERIQREIDLILLRKNGAV